MPSKGLRALTALLGAILSLGCMSLILRLLEQIFLFNAQQAMPAGLYALVITLPCFACGLLCFTFAAPIYHKAAQLLKALEVRLQNLPAPDVVFGSLGLLLGLLVAYLLSTVYLPLLPGGAAAAVNVFVYLVFGYLGTYIAARRWRELPLDALRKKMQQVLQPEPAAPPSSSGLKILDTSALIDGRVAEVQAAGFLDGPLLVPQFVLEELQRVADSAEPLKRQRGRHGLEVLEKLRRQGPLRVEVVDADAADPVDARLVKLARARGAAIVSVDYNLNKVARLLEVPVLSLNQLAEALRPAVLAGEGLSITLAKEGREPGQAVGYLEDGTMVVVAGGRSLVGQITQVVVTSVHQTAQGRMIFARLPSEN